LRLTVRRISQNFTDRRISLIAVRRNRQLGDFLTVRRISQIGEPHGLAQLDNDLFVVL